MKIKSILRYLLAFLCLGMLGTKIANAQSCSLSGGYGAVFVPMGLSVKHNFQTGNIWAYSDGSGSDSSGINGYGNGGTSVGEFTWSNSDGVYWGIPSDAPDDLTVSNPALSLTPGSGGIEFHIVNSIGGGAADHYNITFNDVIVNGANNPFAVSINGTTLSSLTGNSITSNGIDWNTNSIVIQPYDPTGGTDLFTFDSLQIGYTITDAVTGAVVCTVTVPEPSALILIGLGGCGFVLRRKR